MNVIVPYRDRQLHLNKFVPHMNKRGYNNIFVIEQVEGKPFNRGRLLNIGALEFPSAYYALHDVDMLPIQADYSYPENPTHLATKAQQFGYKMPFKEYFGGVVLISHDHMIKSNGFGNEFWGWGAEDDHFRDRILSSGLKVESRDCTFASLSHPRNIDSKLHKKNIELWKKGDSSGLHNCTYRVLSKENFDGYTKITVDI